MGVLNTVLNTSAHIFCGEEEPLIYLVKECIAIANQLLWLARHCCHGVDLVETAPNNRFYQIYSLREFETEDWGIKEIV